MTTKQIGKSPQYTRHRLKPAPRVFLVLLALTAQACSQTAPVDDLKTDADKAERIDRMYLEYRDDFPDAPELSVAEFTKLRSTEDVVLVDVREPRERAVSIIPGSIAKEEFEKQRENYEGKKVVVHCTIGYRSGKYVEELKRDGMDAYNLKGSILSWVHAGEPLIDPDGEATKSVHVYGERWDLLPEGYESVW